MGNETAHNRGFAGEQAMGFYLGERGYFFIQGPSGAAGHGITAPGFDGVAYNPKTGHLIIYDNKAFARAGNVSSATAIDPVRNLHQNLGRLIQQVHLMSHLPNRTEILNLLRRTQTALHAGKPMPVNVLIAVSNAFGNSTGISQKLVSRGIGFINYNQLLRPPSPFSRRCLDTAGLLGSLLGSLAQSIGDIAIQQKVRSRLEGDLAQPINAVLMRGDGVLVIIRYQEWENKDFQGRRARNLLGVHIQGGATQKLAREAFSNRVLEVPPKGWRLVTEYGWIPPLQ